MQLTHDPHEGRGIVLHDGCERCKQHAIDLYDLDDGNLRRLADLAETRHDPAVKASMSTLDFLAMNQLRLYARMTFKSGITEGAAR